MYRNYCILILVIVMAFSLVSCDKNNNGDDNNGSSLTITSTNPADGATGVSVNSNITITFSASMDAATAEQAFSVSPNVNGSFSWNGNSMVFDPSSALGWSVEYTVTVASSAQSAEDDSLGAAYSFTFTTQSNNSSNARAFPDTTDGIYIFSDQFTSNQTDAQWRFAAEHYAGCQKMTLSSVRKLRGYNPDFIVLHYRLAHGAGNHEIIKGDSWVYYWNDVNGHENWFIHMTRGDQSSARVRNSEWDWDYMDPSGSIDGAGDNGWKEYFVSATMEEMRATECDGVFADSCGLVFSLSSWPGWLSGTNQRTTWLPHVNTFMQYVMNRYKAEDEEFYFIPNAGSFVTGWDDITDFSICDGVMVEGFSEWGGGSLEGEYGDWVLQMNNILSLTTRDKIVIMQTYPDESDIRARMFALGCYLLVKGNYSYINMPAYGDLEVFWWPEYNIDLGAYTTSPPSDIGSLRLSDGLFRREYRNGWVYVNPTGSTVTRSLGGTFRMAVPSGGGYVPTNGSEPGSLNYNNVTSITLNPGEAAILLKN